MEGRGGDFKSPFHFLHHLPRRPPWITGRSWHRNAVCTNSTTLAQFSSSSVQSSLCYLSPPSRVAASLSLSPRLAVASHPLRSSARILDGPPARLFRRRFTALSISTSVGTPSSTAKGSMVTGMVFPGGGYPAVKCGLLRRDPLERSSSRWRGAVHCRLVPPLKAVPRLLGERWVRLHQSLQLTSCLK